MKQITVQCVGAAVLPLHDLLPFQGDLKTLSKDNYERLRKEILEDGFSFPVAVWEKDDETNFYIIDGHQRVETLHRMREEGYSIPQIPVVFVKAKSFEAAKRKLLAGASTYGTINEPGLLAFLADTDLAAEDLVANFNLNGVDLQAFVGKFMLDPAADEDDLASVPPAPPEPDEVPATQPLEVQVEAPPASQVRMVQLFLDSETQPEFLKKCAWLQEKLGKTNLTDTVLEVVRDAFDSERYDAGSV